MALTVVLRVRGPGRTIQPVTINILLDAEARTGHGALGRCLAHVDRLVVSGTGADADAPCLLSARACAALARSATVALGAGTGTPDTLDSWARRIERVRELVFASSASPTDGALAWPAEASASAPPRFGLMAAVVDLGAAALVRDAASLPVAERSDVVVPTVLCWARLMTAALDDEDSVHRTEGAAPSATAWVRALDARVQTVCTALGLDAIDGQIELALAELATAVGAVDRSHAHLDRFVDVAEASVHRRARVTLSVSLFGELLGAMAARPARRREGQQLYERAREHGIARPVLPTAAHSLAQTLMQSDDEADLRWAATVWQDAFAAATEDRRAREPSGTLYAVAGSATEPTTAGAALEARSVWVHGIFKVVPADAVAATYGPSAWAALQLQGQQLVEQLQGHPSLANVWQSLQAQLAPTLPAPRSPRLSSARTPLPTPSTPPSPSPSTPTTAAARAASMAKYTAALFSPRREATASSLAASS